jgi:ubiquinone/menaquinone biosynthesis C-methylase UbiE
MFLSSLRLLMLALFGFVALSCAGLSIAVGQQPSQPATAPPVEEARDVYMGRQVAQYMTYHGAGWLIRDSRNREEATDRVIKELDLQPGMAVCDLGCGNGFYTLRFARQVAPRGRVFAVDIQPEMLKMLSARVARARLDSVVPIKGEIDNPNLPTGELDLVFMADVYHEFSHPESMLYRIRESLKPEGVVALLEYRDEDPSVPIKPEHKMSKDQIMKEYEANGLKLVREFNGLPWQHLMYFARDDSPLEAIEPEPWPSND